MQVKYKKTVYEDLYLDDETVNSILIRRLYKLFNWGSEYYIKDRQVWTTSEYLTSHRFEREEVVRDATEEDYKTEEMINSIREKIKEN